MQKPSTTTSDGLRKPRFQRICFIHYHEVGLKGHNRGRFVKCLCENVAHALRNVEGVGVVRIAGHIAVELDEGADKEQALRILSKVPGIAKVSAGYRTELDLSRMCEAACLCAADSMPFTTFKIEGKRSNTAFAHGSRDINRACGSAVQERYPDLAVDCTSPECVIEVQAIQTFGYAFVARAAGPGGLPVGSGGKVLSLLSSGIDSPVATWKMIRRGAVAACVHFSGAPQSTRSSEYLVRDIVEALNEGTGGIGRLYICEIGNYQREISLMSDPKLRVLMYRRLMIAVSGRIAHKEGCGALVTGESLGQVASQTLDNIRATDELADIPVFRPLIGSDKAEIVDRAKSIGTYGISIQSQDDCCTLFMPRRPETHAKMGEVLEAWSALPVDKWVTEIVENSKISDFICPRFAFSL